MHESSSVFPESQARERPLSQKGGLNKSASRAGSGAVEPWRSAVAFMDERWYIDVDREVARARLVKRRVAPGIVGDILAAEHRVSSMGFLHADDIVGHRLPAQKIVRGVEHGY